MLLIPSEHFGIVVLTNAYPIGVAEGLAFTFTDVALYGTFPLRHYDRDVFTYETEGENAAGVTEATFTIGADGKATTVVVENLNVRGEGTFKRPTTAGAQ